MKAFLLLGRRGDGPAENTPTVLPVEALWEFWSREEARLRTTAANGYAGSRAYLVAQHMKESAAELQAAVAWNKHLFYRLAARSLARRFDPLIA